MKLLSICKRNKQCCRLIKWPVPLSSVPKRKGRRIKYGDPGILSLVAVSRKLLRIIFAIVRDDSEFIMNYESQKREEIRRAA